MDTNELVRVSTAARRLGVERQTAYRYVRDGKLRSRVIDGVTYVFAEDLDGFDVKPPNRNPKNQWTRAMTMRRMEEWNDAVHNGDFLDGEGRVSPDAIRAFEERVGWKYNELLDACEEVFE
jgi:excisionase family DNA binding protein